MKYYNDGQKQSLPAHACAIMFVGVWLTLGGITCAIMQGCTVTIPQGAIDAVQAALTNKPAVVVAETPITPEKPVAPAGCTCDLSKPLAVPLSYLGDEATVDGKLGRGEYPECGSMPAGIRYHLLRPSGKCWSFADMSASGLIEYKDGKVMAKCGQWKGQQYHPVFKSAHDQGLHMPGTKITPAQWYDLNGENFIYFECR